MTDIKIIYFDSVSFDTVTFENRLRSICQSIYIIKNGLVVAHYHGSAHDLFNQLVPNDNRYNVLVADLDTTANSYWGFMNKDLWDWMKGNISNKTTLS